LFSLRNLVYKTISIPGTGTYFGNDDSQQRVDNKLTYIRMLTKIEAGYELKSFEKLGLYQEKIMNNYGTFLPALHVVEESSGSQFLPGSDLPASSSYHFTGGQRGIEILERQDSPPSLIYSRYLRYMFK
jgi:hypothetical protein